MTSPRHAAVFLDHQEAKIFHVDREGFDETKLHAPAHHVHRHPKGASEGHNHPDDERRFFDEVAKALASVEQVLVAGPGIAKLQFVRHLHAHDRALEAKVVGLETVDHPTDKQLVAYAKKAFGFDDARVR